MVRFQVEIKFPRGEDAPNTVTVIGSQENVEECIDHLLNLEEEYMQDIVEKEDMEMYMAPSSQGPAEANMGPQKKKEVRKAFGVAVGITDILYLSAAAELLVKLLNTP